MESIPSNLAEYKTKPWGQTLFFGSSNTCPHGSGELPPLRGQRMHFHIDIIGMVESECVSGLVISFFYIRRRCVMIHLRIKKVLALVIVAALSFGVVGCGGNGANVTAPEVTMEVATTEEMDAESLQLKR
jgi:hypothetical protein